MITFSSDAKWVYVKTPLIDRHSIDTGKQITWIRCAGRTTLEERIEFFKATSMALLFAAAEHGCGFPLPRGKIAIRENDVNLVPMLFYAPSQYKDKLLSLLELAMPDLANDQRFAHWFAKQGKGVARTVTWGWRWKSDQETYDEIATGQHYRQTGRVK